MHFELDPEQNAAANAWIAGKKPVYGGAVGGRYTYSFTPTTIGTVIKLRDAVDGDELDLSDYDSW